ncbi:bifunctional tetrahydrofolate synthase/dihydrofolate synthase [Candidatus Kinetoplastidibacterium crithidiae]|uniref:Dihydrofolate synthase/folylpolyglutamate synthase n=1 Tax=Candidatus Kinetoplastidibacterium crithidiae TCC036E TaxID=1208918 RepID=M1LPK6_9PROT|nr:bifunctional tetrahydrofolate synthase/dihydrofolate synthase [Candidatus Kinetoplastibacterium crithidii]AFZ82747.1 folylpolyglutamate synthase/dihydrofolate synthase FolC [Candidatus Kinetoplastibacterium crithidii (ex Angomonas deanei ATCC 30255)]AGF47602.1 dihydrofolate synthase/folylpolyglutamate synthase [Candidatus Kinetoplastibacterium crithidii TCC036E]
MKPNTTTSLSAWLKYLERIHPKNIDLGLDRVNNVFRRMNLKIRGVKFIVGGTNGKGSTCAFLESFLLESGYSVGLYTSPHILSFSERIRVNGNKVGDQEIIDSFCFIENIRKEISLTYFEYSTLAALNIFANKALDALILEVGLGGRLDAVNIIDADCSIITNIGIDHVEWLGNTRDSIGKEKSYIYRKNKSAICGDINPPDSLLNYAYEINANLRLINKDFSFIVDQKNASWSYFGDNYNFRDLSMPKLFGNCQIVNATVALSALDSVYPILSINCQVISLAIEKVFIPARFQVISNNPNLIIDVSHNSHAANVLSDNLQKSNNFHRTYAIIGMLKDKDIREVIRLLSKDIDYWYCASTYGERGLSSSELENIIKTSINIDENLVRTFPSPSDALNMALTNCSKLDRILVFGSFITVSEIYSVYANKL